MSTVDQTPQDPPRGEPLLVVRNLKKYFPIKKGILVDRTVDYVKAVDDVSFDIYPSQTLGLVGESGSGKSTSGYCVLQLLKPTDGSVKFLGEELTTMKKEGLRQMRREMQIVFQDPYASLNPRMTVGNIVAEPLLVHKVGDKKRRRKTVEELLEVVGFNPDFVNRYPHEFSGGQRQRIGIARALALNPRLIVCDEPVSALDVSIQAQILNLLKDLQSEFGLAYLFVAHDLAVVRTMSDDIAVMNKGQIVEQGPAEQVYSSPRDEYTKALLAAVPVPDPRSAKKRIILAGDVPSPIDPPPGCRFHTRCPLAIARCRVEVPVMKEVAPGHFAACHLREGKAQIEPMLPARRVP
jgi:oligopeptide/dipeptide ABC transporter ATP-binding protein